MTKTRACVPHTPYTLVLKFVPSAGRVYGAATHAVGGDAGYSLLAQGIERVGSKCPPYKHLYSMHLDHSASRQANAAILQF